MQAAMYTSLAARALRQCPRPLRQLSLSRLSLLGRTIHTSGAACRKTKPEPSPEPYRFTTSDANMKILASSEEANEHQGPIVAVSLLVFLAYFLYFREENDLDEQLNVGLFERVPQVEEPHLAQAIPRMKEKGVDTTEAEARLKELIQERQARERS